MAALATEARLTGRVLEVTDTVVSTFSRLIDLGILDARLVPDGAEVVGDVLRDVLPVADELAKEEQEVLLAYLGSPLTGTVTGTARWPTLCLLTTETATLALF
jgi:hypothetical protein